MFMTIGMKPIVQMRSVKVKHHALIPLLNVSTIPPILNRNSVNALLAIESTAVQIVDDAVKINRKTDLFFFHISFLSYRGY